jgi:hypothetical protein
VRHRYLVLALALVAVAVFVFAPVYQVDFGPPAVINGHVIRGHFMESFSFYYLGSGVIGSGHCYFFRWNGNTSFTCLSN